MSTCRECGVGLVAHAYTSRSRFLCTSIAQAQRVENGASHRESAVTTSAEKGIDRVLVNLTARYTMSGWIFVFTCVITALNQLFV